MRPKTTIVRLSGYPNLIELCFYSSFRRNVLKSGICERWFKKGPVRPTRPCCFAAAELSFLNDSLCFWRYPHRCFSRGAFFGILSGGRRHWAAALKSGHAVQRKRCGSLNLSFSYREAARRRRTPLPTLEKRFLEPRRPLVGAFRRPSGVCPSPAGFSFFREMVLQK